jgi:hypothetical protein
MDHREPPRIVDAEGTPRRRFARLVPPPAARRPALARLGIAALGGAVALALVVAVGAHALRAVVAWLHGQPSYQLDFRDITLDPPPPSCYRWGARGFLDRVRAASREPETLPVLDLDLGHLARQFTHYGWVKKVEGASLEHPKRVTVRLVYREPVARLQGCWDFALDQDGVVLAGSDIDWEAAGPLVGISLLNPPEDPKPGLVCRPGPSPDVLEPAVACASASRLAGFLKPALARDLREIPEPSFVAIVPSQRASLYVQFSEALMFHWGRLPGEEPPGEPPAEAKWTMLRDWLVRHRTTPARLDWLRRHGASERQLRWVEGHVPPPQNQGIFLKFTRDGVALIPDDPRAKTFGAASGGSVVGLSR